MVDVFLEVGNVGDHEVADRSVQDADGCLSEEEQEGTDTIGNEEGGGVFEGEDESAHGRGAEVVACEGHLDVGILIDEFDESVEAV